MKYIGIALTLSAVLCLGGSIFPTQSDRIHTFHYENVLGTSLELKFDAGSEEAAEKAESAALAEIDREAKILSAYDSGSEFSRWIRTSGRAVPVSSDLFQVLDLFDQWRNRTGGALDASAETVVRVWKKAAAEQRMPSAVELAAAVQEVRQQHWTLDRATQSATHLSDAPLALNSFAKSYIINRAADAALTMDDVRGAVVNIGGDMVVRGEFSQRVQIADPRSDSENSAPIATLQIRDRAVATSGNYRRGVEIGGVHYSHIVDPRTGQPADQIISSTVVAQNAADAGALATAFSVLSPQESKRLASSVPGVEYLLVQKDGRQLTSPGWEKLLAVALPRPALFAPATTGNTWNPSYELVINLELSRIDGNRVRRPYAAVWIEDKDKFPVRTLALWYEKPRWLPELKSWTHSDRLRAMAEGSDITNSISSATRPPGKYSLKWDGKDNAGKLVKPGAYTVYIEVAREHGTYQLMQQEMDFSGAPKQIQLSGNTEVASVSLDYHKITNR